MSFRQTERRKPYRAPGPRRHARQRSWCVHCGTAIIPCTCMTCDRAFVAGRQRKTVIVAVWMGDDIAHLDRDYRWMHEGCIGQRFKLVNSENSPVFPIKLPPEERPACVINLTTGVVPAPRGPRVEPITWRKMADS